MSKTIKVSSLNKTWILDIDGTLVKHNGYLIDGQDTLISGVKEFIEKIPKNDFILLLTARENKWKKYTVKFLKENKIRYDSILFEIPKGERILINDKKPSGTKTAIAINSNRDKFITHIFVIDENL